MKKENLRTLLGYLLPVLSVILLLEANLAFKTFIGTETPSALFFIAVILSASYGGWGPGVAATLLAALAINYSSLSPLSSPDSGHPDTHMRLAAFTLEALLICMIGAAMYSARRRAEARAAHLQDQIKERIDAQEALRLANGNLEKHAEEQATELARMNRVLSERSLELSRCNDARYRCGELLKQMSDAIVISDLEGHIREWLEGAEAMFGYRTEEAIGKPLSVLFPADRCGELTAKIMSGIGEIGMFSGETPCLRADGTQILIQITARPFYRQEDPAFLVLIGREITEQRSAEEKLKKREEQLAVAQQIAHVGNWEWDIATNAIVWSDELYRIYGLQPQERAITSEVFLSLLHPADREIVGRIIQQACSDLAPFRIDHRIIRPDGEVRTLHAEGEVVLDTAGRPIKIIGIGQDITRFKQTVEALQASEAKFREMVESAPDAIAIADAEGRIALVNKETERRFGYQREELIGKPIEVLVPERFRKVHIGHRSRYAAEPAIRPMGIGLDLSGCRKDGTEFPIEISLSPAESPDGFHVVSIIRDITDRKKAELGQAQLICEQAARAKAVAAERHSAFLAEASRILASSLDYVSTLESLGPLIVPFFADWCSVDIVEKDDRIRQAATIHVNPAQERLFLDLRRKYPPRPSDRYGIYSVLRTGKPEIAPEISDGLLVEVARDETHLEMLRKLGPGSYMCMPLLVRGKAIGAMTFISTASGRRYGQKDLVPAEELARRAASAIDNSRAYQEARLAREEAEEANRAKDDFLATLSHELRTPLNGILGWSCLLSKGTLDPSTSAAAFQSIERNARVQSRLIEDLLDVSRIISGKLKLDVREIDLMPVIEAALSVVAPAAEAKRIQIQPDLDPKSGLVLGDAGRLQQVVWNLLSNAIKFTPEGGRVGIRLEQIETQVRIQVSDTGQGIPREFLPHVFERFRQADSTSRRIHGGLGLGLSIVRHVVELHGGTVRAESAGKGKGATLTATLPLRAVKEEHRSLNQNETPLGSATPRDEARTLEGLRVLVVEDEADAREFLSTVLRQVGAKVIAVGSVQDAIGALDQSRPDVLVSDIAIPGEDGYSLIRKLKRFEEEHGVRIPAAALTGYAGNEDREKVLSAGFQLHLTKPVEPEKLTAVVAKLAGRAAGDKS